MKNVSNSFNAATKLQTREIKARATFLLDSFKCGDSQCTVTTSSSYDNNMNVQAYDDIKNIDSDYATYEGNGIKLDGSKILMPDTLDLNNHETGWWSNNISDKDGNIDETITIIVPFGTYELSKYSFNGFCIKFYKDCYPTDFTVKLTNSQGASTEFSYSINDNKDILFQKIASISNVDTITIHITRLNKPYWRARIIECSLGLMEEWTDDDITSIDLVEEIDPTFASFPDDTLSITVKNSNNRYDALNETGIYKYLKDKQEVILEFGVRLENGQIEWAEMGRYYYSNVSINDTAVTAKFEFISYMKMLEELVNKYEIDKDTFYEFIDEYLRDLDRKKILLQNNDMNLYDQSSFSLHDIIKTYNVNPYFAEMNMADVIKKLSVLSGFIFKLKRTNEGTFLNARMVVEKLQDYVIDLNNSYSVPKVESVERVSEVTVTDNELTLSDNTSTCDVNGFTIYNVYNYGWDYSYTSFGGPGVVTKIASIDGSITYASNTNFNDSYYDNTSGLYILNGYKVYTNYTGICMALDNGSNNLTLNIRITYKTFNDSSKKITKRNTKFKGQSIELSNELMKGAISSRCTVLMNTYPKAKITCNWRGNPALDCFDRIPVEDKYGNIINNAYITKQTYSYAGYLKCTTELMTIM